MIEFLKRVERRTWLGIALAAAAALLALNVSRPAPTFDVVFANSDLPAGIPLSELDLDIRPLSSGEGMVVEADLSAVNEWSLAEPIAKDEPLVPSLLRAPERTDHPDLLALSVDPAHAVLGRLSAGDVIDIYVTWDADSATERLAEAVHVVEARTDDDGFGDAEVQMLLAVDRELAELLTGAVHIGALDIVKRAQ